MTLEDSFKQWSTKHDLYDLPWQIDAKVLHDAYSAGWLAGGGHPTLDMRAGVQSLGSVNPATDSAAMIWAAWPVKKAKGAAIPAIVKALKKIKPMDLLESVQAMSAAYATWPAAERQYLPMCSTWMNQERWLDDRTTWLRGAAAMPSQFSKTNHEKR